MKKKILIAVAILAGLGVIGLIAFAVLANGSNSRPIPSTVPIPSSEDAGAVIEETDQYAQATQTTDSYTNFLNNGELKTTNSAYLTLGAWTVNEYLKASVQNPYFITDYWGTKDDYTPDSLTTYVSPYLSKELNSQFLEAAKNPESEEFKQFFNNKLFVPPTDLMISPQCYETWEEGYCFATPPEITDLSYTGLTPTSIEIKTTTSVTVLYQKPDSPEGNLISQERVYNLTFVVEETTPPITNDTKIPITTISSIEGSLEIKQPVDYLINEG